MTGQETKYEHAVQAVFSQPWAILPSVYAVMCEVIRARAEGHRLTAAEIQERIGAAPVRAGAARNGPVAVIPLFGILAQRMNLMTAMSGGTSTELFGRAFQAALADPEVSAIVIDIDSPGGSVFGVAELGQLIYDARGQKPVIAQANSQAASAAYWVASQADEIVVTPSGEVGSIGVIAHHQDISVAEEMQGVKDTLVTYGDNKAIANPFEPLSESAQAYLQKRADEYGVMFDQAVARGRGVSAARVRAKFGQGLMFGAEEAVKLGMADRVGTLQQTLDRLTGRRSARSGARAELDPNELQWAMCGGCGERLGPRHPTDCPENDGGAETQLDAADIVWEAELIDLRARRLRC